MNEEQKKVGDNLGWTLAHQKEEDVLTKDGIPMVALLIPTDSDGFVDSVTMSSLTFDPDETACNIIRASKDTINIGDILAQCNVCRRVCKARCSARNRRSYGIQAYKR